MRKKMYIISGIIGVLAALMLSFSANIIHADSLWDSITGGLWQHPVTRGIHIREPEAEESEAETDEEVVEELVPVAEEQPIEVVKVGVFITIIVCEITIICCYLNAIFTFFKYS